MEIDLINYMTTETYENPEINNEVLRYRVYVPKVKRRKYKVFIYLHGSGERGDDNLKQIQHHAKLINYIIDHPIYGKETIIIAPQVPEDQRWVPLDDIRFGTYNYDNNPVMPIQEIFNDFLEKELDRRYKVDPQFVYISGISMGGAGAIDYVTRYPGKFAACLSICGTLDLSQVNRLRRTPMWLFHSSDDTVVDYRPFKVGYEKLLELKADVQYTEFNDTGHGVWVKAYEEPGLIDWIFSKKKTMPRF